MRWIISSLVSIAFCLNSTAFAQDFGPKLETNEPKKENLSIQPVQIKPKDDEMVKLRKEKLNAVIAEIKASYALANEGRTLITDIGDGAKRFRDAVVDLDDAKLTINSVNQYVRLMDNASQSAQALFATGRIDSRPYHRFRYHHLDARLLQMQVKKRLEGK